jgi:hypothetical protein
MNCEDERHHYTRVECHKPINLALRQQWESQTIISNHSLRVAPLNANKSLMNSNLINAHEHDYDPVALSEVT